MEGQGVIVQTQPGASVMAIPISEVPSGQAENAVICPPGMEYLIGTSAIMIHQMVDMLEVFTGWDTNNRYEIQDFVGRRIYLAAEMSNGCLRMCCGVRRPWTINVLNNAGVNCLKISRTCGCLYCCCCGDSGNEVEVRTATDMYVGKVSQSCFDCFGPSFAVVDREGNHSLTITGPCTVCMCCTVKFKVTEAVSGAEVGIIEKHWGGVVKEAMTEADSFGVSFLMNMDPRLKSKWGWGSLKIFQSLKSYLAFALLLGAVFLIDFMFFEGKDPDPHHRR